MQSLEAIEIETGTECHGSVIWLHGLGADGHDFEPIVPELNLTGSLSLRFIFPHAPMRPVTLNAGMVMRAWYDVLTLDRSGPQDEAGIRESAESLLGLVARERERGIAHERIVLAGFSQGGAIAMHAGLRFPSRLAGIMALSSWLPLEETIAEEVVNNPGAQPHDVPFFLAHGTFDPMLPIEHGRQAHAALQDAGYGVEWHEYPMAHAVCAEEIADIRNWLVSLYAESN